MQRRALLASLLAAPAAALASQAPAARWRERLAAARGRSPSPAPAQDTNALQWLDPQRQRSLPLRLRLPPGTGVAPLVLFSHGLGGNLDAGTRWAQAWAQAGIATLHLQHPGSDTVVLRTGGMAALKSVANATQLAERARDVHFVLNELANRQRAGDALLQRLDLQAIGVAGHSFGAHTSMAVAGQRFAREGAALADPRPRAFAAFSPSPGQHDDPRGAFADIRRPVLCLTGSLDADALSLASPRGREAAERADRGHWRRAVFDALPAGDKAELWLEGADHATFAGSAPAPGRTRPPAALEGAAHHDALIAQTTTLWWQAQLQDDERARDALQRPPAALRTGDQWRRG